jgi:hypothetical protein
VPNKKKSRAAAKYFVQSIIPLDEFLCLVGLPYKMTKKAMLICAEFGQDDAYGRAGAMMRKYTFLKTSDSLVEEVTDHVGKYVFERDNARAEEEERKMPYIEYDQGSRKGAFYIMVDGGMADTRVKNKKTGSSYREVKVGMLFAGEDSRVRGKEKLEITRKEYVACVGTVEEFQKYLFEAAVRNHCFDYEKIVVVSDGAQWIRTMCEFLFPGAIQILDYFHLKENLYNFGKYAYGNDEKKYVPWAEGLLTQLREGKTETVVRGLECYAGKVCPEGILNPYPYLKHNEKKVNYAKYKAEGLYIGSGAIESAIKTIVQRRCKQAGMQWNIGTLQTMVTLRTKWESGIWDSAVETPFLEAA